MTHRHYGTIIVGAGFTGAVLAERIASVTETPVLVIDQRPHIAGNAFDLRNEDGLLYHRYGPHIFHTNADRIVAYLSRFTRWRPYDHRVLGLIDGRLVPIPFNLTSLKILFPRGEAERLSARLIETYGMGAKVAMLDMRASDDPVLRQLAGFIYDNIFAFYTQKQWGLRPEALSPAVTGRVPVHISFDDRYFQDRFQAMPVDGYTAMFMRMLAHPLIQVELSTSLRDLDSGVSYDRIVHTGAIDAHFDYALGPLAYRSLRFEFQSYRQPRHQPVAQVNYPVSHDFTRITEMSYLTGEVGETALVAIEYPMAHRPGETEPYYPVPRDENVALHDAYKALAARETPHTHFAGRLGDYRYYNMDQAVGRALSLFDRLFRGT